MISLLVVTGLIKILTRTPIPKVIRHPIAFHQNQKISGTYNHKKIFRPTPHKRPILAPIAWVFFVSMAKIKTPRIGPKKTEPILLITSITVPSILPEKNAKNRHVKPQKRERIRELWTYFSSEIFG